MCQSVPNRRGRASAAKVIASAVDGASSKARSQPSAFDGAEKKPFKYSSPANSTSTTARTLTGSPTTTRQPTAPPPFTIATLRKAIPPHCFERSLLRSSLSLAVDLALAAALAALAALGIPRIPASYPAASALRGLAWMSYWWLQGAVCTGIWVQAHECGHQAFSKSQTVNDAVGLVLHSLLLVRGFSFSLSLSSFRPPLSLSLSLQYFAAPI